MWLEHDAEYNTVATLMKLYPNDNQKLKEAMKNYNSGKLWQRLLRQYFHKLRAVRIMAMDKMLVGLEEQAPAKFDIPTISFIPGNLGKPTIHVPIVYIADNDDARRELLSIKTNLLFDFAYMPGYDRFCPIPTVAIEYYPLYGGCLCQGFFGAWWHWGWAKPAGILYGKIKNGLIFVVIYFQEGATFLSHSPIADL